MSIYKNYLKVSIRNIFKQRLYSIINIGGLTAGLAVFILIMLYVNHEYSYDNFYEGGDRLYHVYQRQIGNTHLGSDIFGVTPGQLARVMREEFPEVESATSSEIRSSLLTVGKDNYWEEGLNGDEKFFDVFRIPFIAGNRDKALAEPKSLILTKSLAAKMFGSKDPVGEQIKYENSDLYTITGVVDDPPANSSFVYSFIIHIRSNGWYVTQSARPTWNGSSFHTFVRLTENADPASVEQKFPALLTKYYDPVDYANYPFKDAYYLQTMKSMHLGLNLKNTDIAVKGNERSVNLLMLVAIVILVLACVNYMNLAIARSIKRAKEVGLRKSVGALRRQIIVQFLSESILFALLALILAMGIVYLLLPPFAATMDRKIPLDYFSNPVLLPGLPLLVILIGLISGSYPALVMSSLAPVHVLKGKMEKTVSARGLQRWLLVGQYSISTVLIVCSLGIYLQNEFMRKKEVGYDRDHIITMRIRDHSIVEHRETLRNELTRHPGVLNVSLSSHLPINVRSSHIINDEPGGPTNDDLSIYEDRVDEYYLDVFNIKLIAGRNFSKDFPNDQKESYIINETAAKALGWTPEEAIGKQVWDEHMVNIIGVVKDFNLHSLHSAIEPMKFRFRSDWVQYISIKASSQDIQATLDHIDKVMKKNSPYPFSYEFLDDQFNALYKNETALSKIFGWFTVLSILIASLGLFGLAAFMSAQRTKEIGVRKVLGASIQSIVVLLTKDFLLLVVIAFVISVPIAWYSLSKWLETFAFRIELSWWMFAGAGLLAVLVALFSVGYLSLKASLANPVDSLKSE